MVTILVASVLPLTAVQAPTTCQVSQFWSQIDEAALDREPAPGQEAVAIAVGCSWHGMPGASGTLDIGNDRVAVEVLGLRRAHGTWIVALPPAEARRVRRGAPVSLSADPGGDWPALLQLVNETHARVAWGGVE